MRSNLQIRLLGHCIICLRKVSRKRKRKVTSEYSGESDRSEQPEVAQKSIVSTPGFLLTFNQVWVVLQTKWKIKNDYGSRKEETEISLENVLRTGNLSTNVSFSRAPTICEVCCDKILAIENLMKAVRQQVRELGVLLEEGRRRQDGKLGEFEKNLREEGLEESVIRATLQFVGIFDGSGSRRDDFQAMEGGEGDHKSVNDAAAVNCKKMDSDVQMTTNQVDSDGDNDGQTETISGDDEDPDYVKEEPEEGDDSVSTDEQSEEEMEVDKDDKNTPDYQVEKEDPLASFPRKLRDKPSPVKKWRNQEDESTKKFLCTCGKRYATRKGRSEHLRLNKATHPEFPSHGNQQTCDLCGEWKMYSAIVEHFTDVHLNGQAEWVMSCPNEKCRYKCVTTKAFNIHVRKLNTVGCGKIWKEKYGPVCEICGFRGTNMLKIKNHVRDKHENGKDKKWKCPISGCEKRFFIKQSVHYHLSEHSYSSRPITQQSCDKCQGKIKMEEMEGHLKDKHGVNEVIGCKQCEMKFSGRDEMIEHLYEHRESGIICDICGEDKFGRYVDFRDHYFLVHKLCPKKYKCGEKDCDAWFWRKELRKDHELRTHEQVKKGKTDEGEAEQGKKKCDLCDYEYTLEEYLVKHTIRIHGGDPLSCDICGETFDDKRIFQRHKKEHAGIVFQKEWKCEMEGCGKFFKKKHLWKHHNEVGHGGKGRHVCEECGKGFTFAASLRKHRDAVHLGKRPWVCDECGESFAASGVLKTHKLIHSGDRPFGCDICGQRFRHKSVLGTHLNGHEKKGEGFKPNGPMKQLRKRKAVQ